MSNRKLAIGAGVAVLLGLILGLVFGAGGTKAPRSRAPAVATTREPDSGLQVVVGPTRTAKTPALTPVATAPAPSLPSAGPAAALGARSVRPVAQPAGVIAEADSRPAPLRVAPRPLVIPPAPRSDADDGAAPPLRRATPRPAAPRPPPEPDDEDEGPPAPPPPPPAE